MWIGNWATNNRWIGIKLGKTITEMNCMSWEINGAYGGQFYKREQWW
jgi:hypothetical protein